LRFLVINVVLLLEAYHWDCDVAQDSPARGRAVVGGPSCLKSWLSWRARVWVRRVSVKGAMVNLGNCPTPL
jgi:hypothetical protein